MARRRQRPAPRWQERTASAASPQERLAVAYDRLRRDLAHLSRRRDPAAQNAGRATATALAAEAADFLTRMCQETERIGEGDAA